MRRDDLIHPELSGNKFYKLYFNLQQAVEAGHTRVLSFGGAYSNHIHALAAAGKTYGLETVGVIRGPEPAEYSPTLQDAARWGMQLHFVDRSAYRLKDTAAMREQLESELGAAYIVPEGGANLLGARGCAMMAKATQAQLACDALCVAVGTGGTLAGIASALEGEAEAIGIPVVKGDIYREGGLVDEVSSLLGELIEAKGRAEPAAHWQLLEGYHGGGYGKCTPSLTAFIHRFERDTGVPVEPVYTAKLFRAIEQLALDGYWRRGTRLVAVHTGGLQGRRGFQRQLAAG